MAIVIDRLKVKTSILIFITKNNLSIIKMSAQKRGKF